MYQKKELDFGPTEWAAVTGKDQTIFVHMGLDKRTGRHKDLYYMDNDRKGDQPEEDFGRVGKFGYVLRDLQKEGFDKFPVRFVIYWNQAEEYEKGDEKDFLAMYQKPLILKTKRHEVFSIVPDAPPIVDTREEQKANSDIKAQTRFILPQFILDPNLLGTGPGIAYAQSDFLNTGTYFGAGAMFTDRGYAYLLA